MTASSTPLHRHPAPHKEIARRYRLYLAQLEFRISILISSVLLIAAWFVNYYAIEFATDHASNSVTDIVLSNIPVFEVDAFFVYGTFAFAILVFVIVLAHP